MYDNQIWQEAVAANNNLHQVIGSESKKEQAQAHELTIPDIAMSLSPLSFIIGWVAFFLILRKIRTFLDAKIVFPVNALQKVPCKNCRFYSNNNYLKCAVEPFIVLTEEANNCSEYSSNSNKLSSQNTLSKKNN